MRKQAELRLLRRHLSREPKRTRKGGLGLVDPGGAIHPGAFEIVAKSDGGALYSIAFLPDKNNQELQQEGKPPHYYYIPSTVRIARNPQTGDYKFRLIHFVGRPAGIGDEVIAGGVFSVTTTSAIPPDVLK